MKKVVLSTVVATLVAIAAFSLANAQGQRRRGGPGGVFGPEGRGPGPIPFARLLDLTDEQRQQIQAIVEQERDSREGPRASAGLHRQLQSEILSEAPDQQKIDTLKQQLALAHAEELARQIEVQKKIAQILTPEQRARARDELAKDPPQRGRGGDSRPQSL